MKISDVLFITTVFFVITIGSSISNAAGTVSLEPFYSTTIHKGYEFQTPEAVEKNKSTMHSVAFTIGLTENIHFITIMYATSQYGSDDFSVDREFSFYQEMNTDGYVISTIINKELDCRPRDNKRYKFHTEITIGETTKDPLLMCNDVLESQIGTEMFAVHYYKYNSAGEFIEAITTRFLAKKRTLFGSIILNLNSTVIIPEAEFILGVTKVLHF